MLYVSTVYCLFVIIAVTLISEDRVCEKNGIRTRVEQYIEGFQLHVSLLSKPDVPFGEFNLHFYNPEEIKGIVDLKLKLS